MDDALYLSDTLLHHILLRLSYRLILFEYNMTFVYYRSYM